MTAGLRSGTRIALENAETPDEDDPRHNFDTPRESSGDG